ncbi:hypothetical protein SAMN05216518_14018 [Bacteroidales bacterium KHT7]|nr:hypothetical protein SAMN05216518_14018 [Bacteroidales bacterium KHT7]
MKALPIAFLLQGVPFLFLSTIIMRVRNSVQCLFYFFYIDSIKVTVLIISV